MTERDRTKRRATVMAGGYKTMYSSALRCASLSPLGPVAPGSPGKAMGSNSHWNGGHEGVDGAHQSSLTQQDNLQEFTCAIRRNALA